MSHELQVDRERSISGTELEEPKTGHPEELSLVVEGEEGVRMDVNGDLGGRA